VLWNDDDGDAGWRWSAGPAGVVVESTFGPLARLEHTRPSRETNKRWRFRRPIRHHTGHMTTAMQDKRWRPASPRTRKVADGGGSGASLASERDASCSSDGRLEEVSLIDGAARLAGAPLTPVQSNAVLFGRDLHGGGATLSLLVIVGRIYLMMTKYLHATHPLIINKLMIGPR
jgi:hypothetical protein